METLDYLYYSCYFLIPVAFLTWWVFARLGLDKRWFVVPASPIVSRGFYFALPTLVIGSISLLVGIYFIGLDPNSNTAYFFICPPWPLWLLGFVFAYIEPGWMSPAWYRWLKKEHGAILPMLIEDAEQMGRAAWLKQTKTQQGLEQWVAEVRHKHGLDK